MLYSLKLQRDNRQNALAVDPAKGKTGKKLHFSPHCGDETTTCYNRAFGKGFPFYRHISVRAGSTAGLSFPCFLCLGQLLLFVIRLEAPFRVGMRRTGMARIRKAAPGTCGCFLLGSVMAWLFHLHNMMKIRPLHPVFPLAEFLAKAFGWLFWLAVFKFVADTRFQLERKSSLEIIWRSRNNSSKLDFM